MSSYILINDLDEGEEGLKEFKGGRDEVKRVELSMNSVAGLTEPRTLKLKGKMMGTKVVVSIHYRAAHNFISNELVEKLSIPISKMASHGMVITSI